MKIVLHFECRNPQQRRFDLHTVEGKNCGEREVGEIEQSRRERETEIQDMRDTQTERDSTKVRTRQVNNEI